VEPLHPELRRELLRVHPDLTEADLDEYETLTALRFTEDPAVASDRIAQIDRTRERLLAKMPHYGTIERAFSERRRQTAERSEAEDAAPRVRIDIEPSNPDDP
jgi:hypothetical protein